MGIALLPIILIFIVISIILSIFGSIGNSVSNVASGGQFVQDDMQMEEYALAQYDLEFNNAVGYEDNILIVFLVDENYQDFYTMAIVGYNIDKSINSMFGGRYTEYGNALTENLNSNYKSSLTRNLKDTVYVMKDAVDNLNLKSSFDTDMGSPGNYNSHVTNHSSIDVDESIINNSLESFTNVTDIPIVIVIDDMDAVFDKKVDSFDVIKILFAVVLCGVAVYFIVCAFKEKGDDRNNESNGSNKENRSRDPRHDDTHW